MGRNLNQDSDEALSDTGGHDVFKEVCSLSIGIKQLEKKYKCTEPGCDASFLRPSRLARHKRKHTGERPYKCSYSDCDKSYTNSSHLKRHLETHNATKKTYRCSECFLIISNLHNLKRHYERVHKRDKLFCHECNEAFHKKYQLAKHMMIHFPTLYACDKCERNFTSIRGLGKHKKVHEKKYPCTQAQCTEVFDKWALLCNHMKTKHITEYKCDICCKTFFSKTHLRIHVAVHSEDKSLLSCPYEKCYRVYWFKHNLDHHIRSKHLGEKFYCDICNIGLSTKQKIQEHITRLHLFKRKKINRKLQRSKRKDANIPKRSMVTKLIGLDLPPKVEKTILHRMTRITLTQTQDIVKEASDRQVEKKVT